MIICFLGIHINISRLFTFAGFLVFIVFVQSQLVLAVDATTPRKTAKPTSLLLNKTITLGNISNETKTKDKCDAEIIDETLYYFSVGYRAFAGALVVPITICAICGNTLVIYVIRRYRSLRVTGNVFLASLAVADVGVSTLAMTFYGLQLLYGRWLFGAVSLLRKFEIFFVFYYDTYVYINESKKMLSRNETVNNKFFFFFFACFFM